MAFAAGGSKGVKNEINVTPLVDVVLVLLIIFMVITPMLQRGKEVKLPKASTEEKDEKKQADPVVVSITPDKKVWVESNLCEESCLEQSVQTELQKMPGRRILLKGDESLTVGDVRKVMAKLRESGARGVNLGIEEIKK
ncbi:MAG: biopolymer transporter ExbD [Polyangiaceae bacterium]